MTETITEQPITVGQLLYREIKRRHRPSEIVEVTIGKVGRKYFYLSGRDEKYPVDKVTLTHRNHDYSQCGFTLYRNRQEIADKAERQYLLDVIQKHFERWGDGRNSTLEQLRAVADAVGICVDTKRTGNSEST